MNSPTYTVSNLLAGNPIFGLKKEKQFNLFGKKKHQEYPENR